MKRINYKKIYKNINENKYLFGLSLIILNLFSKYVNLNLKKSQEEFIKNFLTKEIFIFVILFVGIRDLFTSLFLTFVFTILTNTLFHHESRFCVMPERYKQLENNINDKDITYSKIEEAKEILKKAKIKN